MRFSLGFLLLLPHAAWAFCGTFVGAADSDMTNRGSSVILARNGDQTVLTLSMDFEGDAREFGLLLPVPEVLTPEDVSTPNADLIEAVDVYGGARAVAYTCEDALTFTGPAFYPGACGGTMGCSDSMFEGKSDFGYGTPLGNVYVESSFSVAGYDLVVLSAEQSGGLLVWLDENGFAPPEGEGLAILQEYIDAGTYFLAVKINLDDMEQQGAWLPPLQFRYTSAAWSLPIRIGTISSGGEQQEVIINALTSESDGEVGISNFDELVIEDECMFQAEDFGAWYGAKVDALFESDAGWIREHSWPVLSYSNDYHCDPCTPTGDFTTEQLAELGAMGEEVHLTRLRVRYTPEQAVEDLALYTNGLYAVKDQSRFITYKKELEFLWPICEVGFAEDPGECDTIRGAGANTVTGCGPGLAPAGLVALMAGAAALRRRA